MFPFTVIPILAFVLALLSEKGRFFEFIMWHHISYFPFFAEYLTGLFLKDPLYPRFKENKIKGFFVLSFSGLI